MRRYKEAVRACFMVPPLALMLAACDFSPETAELAWDVTPEGLKCSGHDLEKPDGTCVWYCRDFKRQKNADLHMRYTGGRLRMNIVPSEKC